MNKKPTILIVDDDPKLRKTLTDILGVKGFDPISIAKGREALRRIKGSAPNVALIDLKLDDMDGLELIKEIKVLSPSTECIVITGNASQESAVEAVNLGAYSYILKPYDVEQLLITINRAIEKQQSEQRIHNQLRRLEALREIDQAISSSTNLKTILNVLIRRLIENLEVDAGAILLYRPVMQDLEYVTGFGFKAEAFKDIRVRLGEGQAGKAALERRIINIPDLAIESIKIERAKLIQQEKFVAYFGVPLIAKGDIVGVLEVFHRTPVDPSPEWFNFLDTLAGQAAIAINDGRLFENLQRSNIEILQAYDDTLEGWAMALEMRDKETEGLARRVFVFTFKLARDLGIHVN
jgi:DNA-binding response OmpR family regulator